MYDALTSTNLTESLILDNDLFLEKRILNWLSKNSNI